jgi:hypothetical protein
VTVYDVLVTDNNGCTATDIFGPVLDCSCAVLDPAVIASIVPNPACDGDTITFTTQAATGGVPPYTYEWDFEDDATYDATGLTAANVYAGPADYTVRLRITDSCAVGGPQTQETTAPVTVNPLPTPVIAETCGDPNSTLDAGAGYVSYSWSTVPPGLPSDGAKTQTVQVPCNTVGDYIVTVFDGTCFGTSPPENVTNCTCPGGPQPEPSLTMNVDGSQHVVVPHDPATTRYHVYTNPFATFNVAGDEYGSPAGVCLVPFLPDVPAPGEARVDYVLPAGQWMLITAATDSAGSESTVGTDSAGTERPSQGRGGSFS